jgi:hypothetical protein
VVGGGAGGDGEEDGMAGGVVVQPVHAGGERLPGWFFLSSFGVLTVSMFSEAGIQRPVMKQAPKSARILAGVPESEKQ